MARGLELDWVVIRVQPLRKVLAVLVVGLAAAGLVFWAYKSLNLSPEARARRAIERADAALAHAETQPLPPHWKDELDQASDQLNMARSEYAEQNWHDAESLAGSACRRFEALAGAGNQELVGVGQFFSLEGRVQLQRAGQTEWESTHQGIPVFNGDFVRTGRDGNAEILFADGSLYRISPNSLLEIHHEISQEAPGTVKMVAGRINVYTSGAPSTVTTDTAETEIERDSRVAVDVAAKDQKTTVSAFQGSARVHGQRGQTVTVNERESVAALASGTMTAKQEIPAAPFPVEPRNNAGFDVGEHPVIELAWRGRPRRGTVHLQVSRSKSFDATQLDVDAPQIAKDVARLRLVYPGTYFWRVAALGEGTAQSEWSAVRRFRVFSSVSQQLLEDTTPPELVIDPPQQLGHMFIFEGATEVSATVTINNEKVETDADGHFRKTIEIYDEGWTDIDIVAVDPSGNRTERTERVFVEDY
ncbi:MAG: FecR family protein [Acidobacteria bacterium]|nr:FecR family protein [Acidobacteriota bacterium]